jgi:AcrR family transcriptional regulator
MLAHRIPTEPRKRPRQARSVAAVAAMIEATARIVEIHGLESLTTNRVAELAGVSIGSLYQYFPTKESLLAELIRRERGTLLRDIERATESAADLPAIIEAFVRAGLAHQFSRPALSRALEYADTSLPMHEEDRALRQQISDRLAALLEMRGVELPAIAAADLIALCRGMIDAAATRGESDAEALFPRLRRAAMGYLGTGTPNAASR